MIRWRRIIGLCAALFCLLTPAANAADLGKARARELRPRGARGRLPGPGRRVPQGAKMQMRFTLQVSTPAAPKWRTVDAEGFGEWISAPAGFGKYTYDKTVEELLAGLQLPGGRELPLARRAREDGAQRAVDVAGVPRARTCGRTCCCATCADDSAGYVAVVVNRGRTAAGRVRRRRSSQRRAARHARGWSGSAPGAVDRRVPARAPPARTARRCEAVVDPALGGRRGQRGERLAHGLLLTLYARLHW